LDWLDSLDDVASVVITLIYLIGAVLQRLAKKPPRAQGRPRTPQRTGQPVPQRDAAREQIQVLPRDILFSAQRKEDEALGGIATGATSGVGRAPAGSVPWGRARPARAPGRAEEQVAPYHPKRALLQSAMVLQAVLPPRRGFVQRAV
jgi:hypothetical protein